MNKLKVKLLHKSARVPKRQHLHDAGADLYIPANYPPTTLFPNSRITIPLGIALEIPEGWVGLVCPRSGLAHKQGLTVLNAPGIIDCGYTGEVQVVLYNSSPYEVDLAPTQRIAQLVLTPMATPLMEIVSEFTAETTRGDDGFGSTGVEDTLFPACG